MKEGKTTIRKELSFDELLVSYDRFLKESMNRGFLETVRTLLDALEHLMEGSFACCHIVGEDRDPTLSDVYSSKAEQAKGTVALRTTGDVPEREDHWMECIDPKEPVFHEGRSIISCKRKGSEHRFEVDGILSIPIIRSEKVEAVISIANVRHPGQNGIERLVLAANIGWSICELKRAYEALRYSEARSKRAQRLGRIGNWVWDLEGNTLHWSEELYELFGVDPRTFRLTYENILSRIHPEDRERNERTVKRMLEDKAGGSFEFRVIRSDSTVRHVHQVIDVKTGPEGSIKRMIGTMQDITELVKLRSEIEESRDQLRAMFDRTPIMMCLLDGDRRITFCNKAFEEASGWPNTEFGSPFACGALGCINSLDDPRGCGFGPKCKGCKLFNAIEDTWRTGSTHNDVEYSTIISRDGKRKETVLLGSTAKVRIGSKDMLLLSLQDITSIKNVERALRRSREQYRELFQRSIDPIITMNMEMRICDMNIAAIELLGTPLEKAVGKMVNEVMELGPEHVRYFEGLARAEPGDWSAPVEIKVMMDDGTIHLELIPIRTRGEGDEELVHLVFHDITQRKVLEDQMRRSLLTYDFREGCIHLASDVPETALITLLKELKGIGYAIHLVIRPSEEKHLYQAVSPASVSILDRGLLTAKHGGYSKNVREVAAPLRSGDVLYIHDIGYIVLNDGFLEVLKLVQDLRDMTVLIGATVLIRMDKGILDPQQSEALLKECRPLTRRALQTLPMELKRLLDLILEANLNGEDLDHTALAVLSGRSKPTVRKDVRALSDMGLVRVHKQGRRKLIEVTRDDLR